MMTSQLYQVYKFSISFLGVKELFRKPVSLLIENEETKFQKRDKVVCLHMKNFRESVKLFFSPHYKISIQLTFIKHLLQSKYSTRNSRADKGKRVSAY